MSRDPISIPQNQHPSIQHGNVPDGLTPTDMLLRETLSSSAALDMLMMMMGTLVRTHALIRLGPRTLAETTHFNGWSTIRQKAEHLSVPHSVLLGPQQQLVIVC